MRFVSFLLICLVSFSAIAEDCRDAAANLAKARYYRNYLDKFSSTQHQYAGEDIISFSDYDGGLLRLPISEVAPNLAEKLRQLIKQCHVPPAKLGFGNQSESAIANLEVRANRNLLEKKTKVLAKAHHSDSNSGLEQASTLTKNVGIRPNIAAREMSEVASLSAASKAKSLQTAQSLSNASRCTSVDFSSELPPIRDQADASLCFAYAAADMMSFKLKKNVSPLGVAIAYKMEKKQTADFQEGGLIGPAVTAAQDRGVCLDEDFGATSRFSSLPMQMMNQSNDAKNGEFNLLKSVEAMAGDKNLGKEEIKQKLNPAGSCNRLSETLRTQYQNQNVDDIADVINKSNPDNAIFNIYEKLCASKKVPALDFDIEDVGVEQGSRDTLVKIDRELNDGNIIGIGYNSDGLRTPRGNSTGPHGSTVVGRRFNSETGICEYKVRNSWGADCTTYSAVRSKAYPCEKGNVWLPGDVLSDMTRSLSRFTH